MINLHIYLSLFDNHVVFVSNFCGRKGTNMKCYFITNEKSDDSIFIENMDCYIRKMECPEDKVEFGKAYVKRWELHRSDFSNCEATSDNGIDQRDSERYTFDISFDELVFNGKAFIGIYVNYPQAILSFSDSSKSSITVIDDEHYVGGWGYVTEGSSYWLVKK